MLLRHPVGEGLAPPAVPAICLTRRRGGTLARPFSVFGTVPSGAPPDLWHLPQLVGTRRGCKMTQAGILYCTRAQWPGRNEIRNRILRAGTFAETYRGILRKWGSGGGPAGAVRRPRDTPGGVLVPFSPRKKELAQRAKTCKVRRAESSRPTGVMSHEGRAGQETRPYNVSGGTQQNQRTGGPVSRPYGVSGKSQQNGTAEGASPSPAA